MRTNPASEPTASCHTEWELKVLRVDFQGLGLRSRILGSGLEGCSQATGEKQQPKFCRDDRGTLLIAETYVTDSNNLS